MRDQTLWSWHMIAAVVIILLLGMHMTVMHLDDIIGVGNPAGGKAIDWSNVSARMKSGALAVGYIVLLAAALFHGLYGLRNILFELVSADTSRQRIDIVLSALGLVLFAIGTWAAIASYWHASAGGA